jgi:hypothetical protein
MFTTVPLAWPFLSGFGGLRYVGERCTMGHSQEILIDTRLRPCESPLFSRGALHIDASHGREARISMDEFPQRESQADIRMSAFLLRG